MTDRVSTEIRGDIAYVTMTRGEKLNGLDLAMFTALIDAAKQVKRNRDVRAVILQGDGDAFSAGLDFSVFKDHPVRALVNFFRLPGSATNVYQEVCWAWRELPVPVIAVIHGRCYGGGLQLALAADFRYTTPDCEFSVMEARWGLVPDMTGSVTLRELLGMDVAKKLTMTGEVFDGQKAAELGVVTGAGATPLKDAEELAAELASKSPDAVAATKQLFHRTRHLSPGAAFRIESRLQRKLLMGANHKIARAAGAAKKAPEYVRRTFG